MLAHFSLVKRNIRRVISSCQVVCINDTHVLDGGGGGPYPLADLDRGIQILGGSKFARTPVLTVGISGLRENFSRDRGIKEPFWEPKPSMETSVFENAPSKENKFLFD